MKQLLFFAILLISGLTFSQVPQGMSYQAVAFDSNGNPLTNGTVGVRISILDNSITGTVVYMEAHTKTTNAQGLFNLNIGEGTPVTGNFSAINWGINSKFLKVEVDPNGGTNYSITGTNQLMSVPYALYSETVNTSGGNLNDDINESKFTNFAFYSGSTTYAFNELIGNWVGQSGGSSNMIGSNGNFAFYSGSTTYAFNKKTGTWIGQSGGSSNMIGSNGNFAFYNGSTTYAFNKETNSWVGQSGGSSNMIGSNGNFAFYSGSTTYAFNQETGTWVGQSGGSSNMVGSNGNFAFYSGSTTYVFSKTTGTWVGQSGGSSNIVLSESN